MTEQVKTMRITKVGPLEDNHDADRFHDAGGGSVIVEYSNRTKVQTLFHADNQEKMREVSGVFRVKRNYSFRDS